ncbi:MAG TPA: VOC family protein [Polyangiaceae bacterium]
MAERKPIPGKFVWYELQCTGVAKAQAFYAELLAWKNVPFPAGNTTYEMIFAGETPDTMIGGYAPLREGETRGSRWIASVSVEDVDAVARAAAANGGTIVQAPHDVPGAGRGARIADPGGAELSLIKSTRGDPPDVEAAPTGSFFWNELHTTDPAAALAFYEKTVGFTHETMKSPAGDYHVISRGGIGRGGVTGHLPPGVAPHWLPYVHVADVDASAARAQRLGGQIVLPPMDIPDIGRSTVVRDTVGAVVALMKPNPRMSKR